jgi:hypothetical protein
MRRPGLVIYRVLTHPRHAWSMVLIQKLTVGKLVKRYDLDSLFVMPV